MVTMATRLSKEYVIIIIIVVKNTPESGLP